MKRSPPQKVNYKRERKLEAEKGKDSGGLLEVEQTNK